MRGWAQRRRGAGPGAPEGWGSFSRPQELSQLGFPFLSQLEATLREKSQQLEGLQEMKITLEEQLKKETAAKVIPLLVI